MKRVAAFALFVGLGMGVAWPSVAQADNNSARTAVQKSNAKKSRKDMKKLQKAQRRQIKSEKKVTRAANKQHAG